MKKDHSRFTYLLIWLLIVVTSLSHFISLDDLRVITWDVYGYYLYLPAILKYGDTSQYVFAVEHLSQYKVSEQIYQITDWNGYKAPIYTIGMALIYLPFYLIADLIAHLIPSITADGLSPIYQWSIVIGSWIYTGVGLFFSNKILRILKVSRLSILITLCVIFLGTNYFHYATYENGMPHHFLYTLYTVLIYCTIRWHSDAKLKYIIGGSICIALLCLARPSELVSLLIPGLYGIYGGLSWLVKIQRIKKYFFQILIMGAIGLALVFIQMLFWKINLDQWVFNGYQGHHFDFLSPHIQEGLFSFRKGWLIYSPLCMLGIIGIPFLWKYDRRWIFPVLIFMIVNTYIVLSWHIWWYASSFGMRAMIQSYAVLMIPTAFFIEWLMKRSSGKWMIIFISAAGIFLNQFQDWQYRNKILLQDEMNAVFYQKSFMKSDLDLSLRKYIDAPEYYKGDKNLQPMSKYDPVYQDTILPGAFSYTHRIPVKELIQISYDQWINAEAIVSMEGNDFNSHQQARLVVAQKDSKNDIKWRGVRFQQMMVAERLKLDFDFKVEPQQSPEEYVEITIWNNGPDTIYLKTLNVNLYR
ncbi:MAG: hypothetical protein HKN68_12205 [Saprospiraceae bacterium]|nr:hypothetical protein [Saprospiraceae bacterium]